MTTPHDHEQPDAVATERPAEHVAEQQKAAEAYQEMGGTPPTPEAVDHDAEVHHAFDEELAGLLAEVGEDPRSKEQLVADLHDVEHKLAEAEDDALRLRAEFANYRRRAERDAALGRIAGRADVLGAVLDVLDDFDRTIAAAADSPDQVLGSGVSMVHGKLVQALAQYGLTRIDEVGADFDPNRHEAVQKVEAEDGPLEVERVQQVFRPGYLHGDRVLRAAMVVVEQ